MSFIFHSVVEVGTIICDDYLGDAIPTDKVMFYEPGDHILGNISERGMLKPIL